MKNAPPTIFMPNLDDLTENERAWIGFLRLIFNDMDPAPTLERVQGMRLALLGEANQRSKK